MTSLLFALALAAPAPAAQPVWDAVGGPIGIELRAGGDGAAEAARRGGRDCVVNAAAPAGRPAATAVPPRPPHFLYFDVVNFEPPAAGSLYVVVDYFDAAFDLGALRLEYDSTAGDAVADKYRPAERQWGGQFLGEKKWKRAVWELARPRLASRQNNRGDFRLSHSALAVARVELHSQRPTAVDEAAATLAAVQPLAPIGPGGQLTIGGFDPTGPDDVERQLTALGLLLPQFKALGFTSHEVYVRWNLCEPAEGRYDWTLYDRYVELYRRHGIKWVPFLIVGSAYSLPDWFYKRPGSQPYICLEHGEASDIESLWNPELRRHVARFIEAFCGHYGPTGTIESILLGVTGNFGEAIYPATEGQGWTAKTHGDYHSHPGFWAGDRYAKASWRAWLTKKYGQPSALTAAWGGGPDAFEKVEPTLRAAAPSDRAWLDFVQWYTDSMSDYADFWMRTTRRHFAGDIYLCTGGHAPAEHGADFGAQCKLAAAVNAGVRITNEASRYAHNFALTRWVASAGRQYGAYYGFEPAGNVTPDGLVARVYNASVSGAKQLHHYHGNLVEFPGAVERFFQCAGQFQQRRPHVQVAVFYPTTEIRLKGNRFLGRLHALRDCFDFDFQSEAQIADGGLARYKVLLLLQGGTMEQATWRTLQQWAAGGGLILAPQGGGPVVSVEGGELWKGGDAAGGFVKALPGRGDDAGYRAALCRTLKSDDRLDGPSRAMIEQDGREDKVYAALCLPDEIVWYNATDAAIRRGLVDVPPQAIASGRLNP